MNLKPRINSEWRALRISFLDLVLLMVIGGHLTQAWDNQVTSRGRGQPPPRMA